MIDPAKLLVGIPQGLRDPLIESYRQIEAYYVEHWWAPSELNAGLFCEIVYTIIDGAMDGQFAAQPFKPPKMVEACRKLENTPADPKRVGDRSLRVLIPRVLPILYEVRNNRGVGHVAGKVDANQWTLRLCTQWPAGSWQSSSGSFTVSRPKRPLNL